MFPYVLNFNFWPLTQKVVFLNSDKDTTWGYLLVILISGYMVSNTAVYHSFYFPFLGLQQSTVIWVIC